MIIIEECRIDSYGDKLIIEAAVSNQIYYKDVYIDSIIIDTDKTYSQNGPSNKPIFTKTFGDTFSDTVGAEESYDGIKRIRLCLSEKDLDTNLNNNIFFIYIIAIGTPSIDTPCGMDNKYTMGIAVNLRPIYNVAMQHIKELDSSCNIPRNFMDMILRLKAFDLSLRTGNYPIAIQQWNKLFNNRISVSTNKCGCNGIN